MCRYYWPGTYSFQENIKMYTLWLKDQIDSLLYKIYEIERTLSL